jgi:hypothetical protein
MDEAHLKMLTGEKDLSSQKPPLPFMLSFFQTQKPNGTHVQRFVSEKSKKLLDVLGEKAKDGSQWQQHSHGAWILVDSKMDVMFERIVIVLPRPEQHSPGLFQKWAKDRLGKLNRFLEFNNTGKFVRLIAQKNMMIGVLMRRKGYDLQHPKAPFPHVEGIPLLLQNFCREIQTYMSWMNDIELTYIQALKIFEIPQRSGTPIYKLGLDPLPTAVGLKGKAIPLSPVTLIRGVMGELAEQLDIRTKPNFSPYASIWERINEKLENYQIQKKTQACVRELDQLSARIDLLHPDFVQTSLWIQDFKFAAKERNIPWVNLILIGAIVFTVYILASSF